MFELSVIAKMLQFIDISKYDIHSYIIVDEDILYKWNVANGHEDVKNWLKNQTEYKIKLEFRGDDTCIVIYHENNVVLCDEIKEVTYL